MAEDSKVPGKSNRFWLILILLILLAAAAVYCGGASGKPGADRGGVQRRYGAFLPPVGACWSRRTRT